MNRTMATLLFLTAATSVLVGCEPNLEAITAPPPTGTARLDDEAGEIEVSRGVALGFECTFEGRPCDGPGLEIGDENMISVRAAFLDFLSEQGVGAQGQGDQPRTAFVLVGLAEGSTTLTVTSADGDTDFDVTVVP